MARLGRRPDALFLASDPLFTSRYNYGSATRLAVKHKLIAKIAKPTGSKL
jgi:hypothetical protein